MFIHIGLFIIFKTNILLTKVYLEFVLAIKTAIIINNNFYHCGGINNCVYFYNYYYNKIFEKKIVKFESANYINILLFQKYANIFSYLTSIKKVFITFFIPFCSL